MLDGANFVNYAFSLAIYNTTADDTFLDTQALLAKTLLVQHIVRLVQHQLHCSQRTDDFTLDMICHCTPASLRQLAIAQAL